ncbi:HPr family phosphocarrier protein [Kordiimonas pumila]|uniref:HPr family phosphocarrier protein n=1 Tax=Kordiimonas pumila TaxID=2161677 RepID=A0ABV7D0E9_9PROT|nr:HPr family phosphocarrier protein [Kordiimonas pumila]
MTSREVTIANRRGLHARASARFAREASTYDSTVEVAKDGMSVVGTSIMGLMMLGAAKGDTIMISASGSDADVAVKALENLVETLFGEDE